ncbi:hypothetical protein OPT61_g3293 [Boeremia exigua]|uniref:Uncharacterized protein n=1 Tax=Boeremia exigua TaxID=749465 RepID=A0ACC2IIL1_9PLEO|nr:hypothetical protein OPT61_g3293 [Boeremia exigua]
MREGKIRLREEIRCIQIVESEADAGPLMICLIRSIISRMLEKDFGRGCRTIDDLDRAYLDHKTNTSGFQLAKVRLVQTGWVMYEGESSTQTPFLEGDL